ncbi:hypothetical protein [Paracoccus sp. (in: a-proteobacteria)]|uniref:hypothetical protein n=1 Tax=Paracoccus sp. TaxID=267 RepID=UPI0028AEB4C4|nr:hypothetical protein [Paracoccus sp. (in: a-proteobacteria)]
MPTPTPHQPDGGPASCKYEPGIWHGWNGGECPVHPKTVVVAAFHDGMLPASHASDWDWSVNRCPIIAFRIVREYREPREWWVHPERHIASDYNPNVDGWVHVREVIDGEDAS